MSSRARFPSAVTRRTFRWVKAAFEPVAPQRADLYAGSSRWGARKMKLVDVNNGLSSYSICKEPERM